MLRAREWRCSEVKRERDELAGQAKCVVCMDESKAVPAILISKIVSE